MSWGRAAEAVESETWEVERLMGGELDMMIVGQDDFGGGRTPCPSIMHSDFCKLIYVGNLLIPIRPV